MTFLLLPFELTYREFQMTGMLLLALFIFAFCLGALLKTPPLRKAPPKLHLRLDFSNADRLLVFVAGLSLILFALQLFLKTEFDLSSSHLARSIQAQALLKGESSNSSLAFKIAFLAYPASYIYLARQMIFQRSLKIISFVTFGILPSVLASLSMGGRSPLLYAIIILLVSLGIRVKFRKGNTEAIKQRDPLFRPILVLSGIVFLIVSFGYFATVFTVRAQLNGGVDTMLAHAASTWGVTFSGGFFEFMRDGIGNTFTYLVFVFAWYFVQGGVISNTILAQYDGEFMLGGYGIDIFSALLRRVDGAWIADSFSYLLNMDVYGYFPSAFGTLFVDYGLIGVPIAFVWGWLAGKVYWQTSNGKNPVWYILEPFIITGIILSLINTPLGFGNGFITHIWLACAFLLIRVQKTESEGPR